jgi:hypothetical protein
MKYGFSLRYERSGDTDFQGTFTFNWCLDDVLTEARRQTGADALAAALRELLPTPDTATHGSMAVTNARAALAAYERIAK